MKAVLCEALGPIDTLAVRDVAVPEPGAGEVRIRVRAVGVNFPDVLIVQGLYQTKPPLPFSPGGEASGVIDAVGEGESHLIPGDKVFAMTGHGAMAEYLIAPAGNVVPMPDSMPFDVAAGFTLTYATSHHALKQRARLKVGETLLVLGAAGGVGLTAIELGKLMGARGRRRRLYAREARALPRLWCRRDDQLHVRRSARGHRAHLRQGRARRHLRPRRRQICRAGVPLDRVERALSGDRLRGAEKSRSCRSTWRW